MLRVGNRRQCNIPTAGDVSFVGQVTQHTAQHHQPRTLCLSVVQASKLAGHKLHNVAEVEIAPGNPPRRENEGQQPVNNKAMKTARGMGQTTPSEQVGIVLRLKIHKAHTRVVTILHGYFSCRPVAGQEKCARRTMLTARTRLRNDYASTGGSARTHST
jgi:hypothetical protein